MSGIVGILHKDGSPIDPALLDQLVDFQKFRGPDAQQTWSDGHVGLGHTLLRTCEDCVHERQPLSLGDGVWIVADARVDGRSELFAKLKAAGQVPRIGADDSELILRSYGAWGEDCLRHLLGDFAFAIWDGSKQKLFCARDHLGVKPFYYAQIGPLLLFSNTLDCIREHPAVSNRLNDLAIADFLLFDINQDASTTAFADIHRLPAAHSLKYEWGDASVQRYWTLSVTEEIRFKRDEEYIERFQMLLDQAVADRVRTKSAGILMSGGLDSTTVAATARRFLDRKGQSNGLFAETVILSKDEEQRYAGLAAGALRIPTHFRIVDDCQLFEGADGPKHQPPFPEHSAWPDQTLHLLRQIGERTRVALTGNGSDPSFSSRITVHFKKLLGSQQFGRFVKDAFEYLSAEGRFSRLYLRARWRMFANSGNPFNAYPKWLNEDFEKGQSLRNRWQQCRMPDWRTALQSEGGVDAVRSEAIVLMSDVCWQDLFEGFDAGATRVGVEARHPFFDLRVVKFLLALPRLPWCADKELLRRSARGVLPEGVRLRRKSPVEDDPIVALLQKPESAWVDKFEPAPKLGRYISRSRIPTVWRESCSGAAWVNLRPLSLNFWLRHNTK